MNTRYISIQIKAAPKGRPRFWNGRTLTDKKTRQYESALRTLISHKKEKHPPLIGPIHVEIDFYFKRPKSSKRDHPDIRPDVDNLQKAVWDSANGILWNDDAQIVFATASKSYSNENFIRISYGPMPIVKTY